MLANELQIIFDNKTRNISLDELEDIIYQLKNDCSSMAYKSFLDNDKKAEQYYLGEENAFYICLKLLEHLKGVK